MFLFTLSVKLSVSGKYTSEHSSRPAVTYTKYSPLSAYLDAIHMLHNATRGFLEIEIVESRLIPIRDIVNLISRCYDHPI